MSYSNDYIRAEDKLMSLYKLLVNKLKLSPAHWSVPNQLVLVCQISSCVDKIEIFKNATEMYFMNFLKWSKWSEKLYHCFISSSAHIWGHFGKPPLDQGSQTRGPRDAFVWPANIPKIEKIISFDQIKLISNKLRPAEAARTGTRCCGTFFLWECGPPINLSLRPLH